MNLKNQVHVVQTPEWGNFKTQMNTPAVRVGEIQFTKHKIPLLPFYVAYAPKVNFHSQKFSWKELEKTAKKEKCILVRFDVPNVINDNSAEKIIEDLKNRCVKSAKSTFSKHNIVLDISKPLDEISQKLNQKTRYNIKLASKKGVKIIKENNEKGIKIFNKLMVQTARRQKFSPHSKLYYEQAFKTLNKNNMADIIIAYYNNNPLAAWMIFYNGKTVYYPYGTSSREHRDLMASNLMAWETIKLGKEKGCEIFDMWGATNDEKSPWWGFTKFKLGYGGELVEYIDTYDFIVNPMMNYIFNISYNTFWMLKNLIRKII